MQDNNFANINPARLMSNSFMKNIFLPSLIILTIILSGIGTGWLLAGTSNKKAIVSDNVSSIDRAPGAKVSESGKEVGIDDVKTFRDDAEGTLVEGGIDGEGTHHLERPGGVSQNVYLTSSVVDLDQFVGSKIEVSGETIGSKKAGWLMDVGRVKIIE